MNDTHLLLILLYAALYVSLGTWIMRAFVAQLPIELEDAAGVDGAGLAQILVRVVLPLARGRSSSHRHDCPRLEYGPSPMCPVRTHFGGGGERGIRTLDTLYGRMLP